MKWTDRLNRIHAILVDRYDDLSAIEVPPEFINLEPFQCMLLAMQSGYVSKGMDGLIWPPGIKEQYPIFTDMVELLNLEALEYMHNPE